MRIALCDDMPVYLEQLTGYLEAWIRKNRLNAGIDCFMTGEELLWEWEANGDYTVVFLDIELNGINGIEAALQLRKLSPQVSIVFISRYERYYRELFAVYPCQFLEKPLEEGRVFTVMDRITEENRLRYEAFMFCHNRRAISVTLREVLYFTSEKRIIRAVMEQGEEYVFYERLNVLEQRLACYHHRFLRIHQSFLVNDRCVEQYHPAFVRMKNGDQLPVSREYQGKVFHHHRELLQQFMDQEY